MSASFERWEGLSGPEFYFPIELGKVREFARSLYAFGPEYLDGRHPVIPPTFPVIATYIWGYLLEDPGDTPLAQVEINERLSLDAEQEYIYYGPPPRAGDELTGRVKVDRIWEKSGRRGGSLRFYRTRYDYFDRAGTLVGTNHCTSVVPQVVPDTPSVPDVDYMQLPYYDHYKDKRGQLMSVKREIWEQLSEGEGPGGIEMPGLTLTDVVRYQIISGSDGAAHHDVIAARADGWPTYFSIAMLHGGMLGTYAINWLGPENVRRLKLRFLDVIWPGDVLTYAGKVVCKYEEEGEKKVDIELSCSRSADDVPTVGWATFVVS